MTSMTTSYGGPNLSLGTVSSCGLFASCPKTGEVYSRINQDQIPKSNNIRIDGKISQFANDVDNLIEKACERKTGKSLEVLDFSPAEAVDYLIEQGIILAVPLRTKLEDLARAVNIDHVYNSGARFDEIVGLMRPIADRITHQT